MKIIVLANGEWDSEWGRSEFTKQKIDVLICADGGADLAISSGKLPDVLIGDLDSIQTDSMKKCQENDVKIIKFPSQKNQTDLELAMDYAQKYLESYGNDEDEIRLYAAGGKRLDHLQGNIALMLGYAQKGRRIRMVDQLYDAWIVLPGQEIVKGSRGQEISLIALSEQAVVSSEGLYYELDRLTLLQNTTRGISNVFIEQTAYLNIHQGSVLVVLIKANIEERTKPRL